MNCTKSNHKRFKPKFKKQVLTAPLPSTLQTRPVANNEPRLL